MQTPSLNMSQPTRKRAVSTLLEDADQSKRRKIESQNNENKTFLSLPREIRQKILTKVLADALVEDFALMDILTFFRFELQHPSQFHPTRNHVKVPHLSDAASTLSEVHPTIKEDIPYVLEKQLARIEGYYDDWNASGNVWDYKKTDFWKEAARRWMPTLYSYVDTDPKKPLRRLHQILGSIDPADAGCWKKFKRHTSWYAFPWHADVRSIPTDESDQEDEDTEDAEKLLHVDGKCDCGQIAKK
ncbi:hypothetical protein EG328_007801 [Venturia inaequalis]|uniref:Uncharacterized protein n=1 Tax=Venturia inaequalis TaxID=5025 RepID=A0A8H3UCM7_VENIN|nr:hypothetical protein EG327_001324 [Venturia inaequalis]KAE9968071.1 hypothetical protein EG328_007801 [Venturia inaequalis]